MEGLSFLPPVILTKEVTMSKVKLLVHECYAGIREAEEVFVAVFMSNAITLTEKEKPNVIKLTDRFPDSLCSEKGAEYGTSEE